MSDLRVYRLEVDAWPTSDGQPWARFYGRGAAAPHHEVPDWLQARVDAALPLLYAYRDPSPDGRVARRLRYDDDCDELYGVLLPVPKRKHYMSASGVRELARDMEAFGATVRVWRSLPVVFTTCVRGEGIEPPTRGV